MSYSIVKELTGDVSIIDYTTGVIVKTLAVTASLLLSDKTKTGGIYATDSGGKSFWIDTDLVQETQVKPAAAVAFTGTTKDLYELLELSFFYNIINQSSAAVIESNIITPAINTVLTNANYIIVCAASILLKLPATPEIGQVYKIFANNNTINLSPSTVGHTIIGKTSIDFKNYTAIIVHYVALNTWLII